MHPSAVGPSTTIAPIPGARDLRVLVNSWPKAGTHLLLELPGEEAINVDPRAVGVAHLKYLIEAVRGSHGKLDVEAGAIAYCCWLWGDTHYGISSSNELVFNGEGKFLAV